MKQWIILALLLPSVAAVTIHGTVYDFGLDKLPNAIVEINSSPRQKMVSKEGLYSFSVPPGEYQVFAYHPATDARVEENVSAPVEGEYVLDLIVLPSFEEEEALLEVPDVPEVEGVVQDRPASQWLLWLVVFVALGFLVYKAARKPEQIVGREMVRALPEELAKVLEFIEKEGGRTTQKDIRRQFPYSEAKMSLMLDDLEERELIKRIKKGRGNVIVRR